MGVSWSGEISECNWCCIALDRVDVRVGECVHCSFVRSSLV